jgi:hypothetical protein
MGPHTGTVSVYVAMGIALAVMLPVWIAVRVLGRVGGRTGLNSTEDWTPGPDDHPETPTATCLTPYDLKLITRYLESGETLEGFARAFFVPSRAQDWKFGSGLEKLPLLVAATSRRMLLFEVTLLNVHRTCFVPYDEVESLDPPKPGIFGTSGRMKVRLRSGREYQFGFLGPLFNAEGMRQEQHLAEYFRGISAQIGSPSGSGSSRIGAAA